MEENCGSSRRINRTVIRVLNAVRGHYCPEATDQEKRWTYIPQIQKTAAGTGADDFSGMPAQQKMITSFFTTSPKTETSAAKAGRAAFSALTEEQSSTRKLDQDESDSDPPSKRLKFTDRDDKHVSPSAQEEPQPSTPDQKERIHHNYLHAKLIRQCRKTPLLISRFGLTWFEALEKEFSKEYFIRLSEFVVKERAKSTVYPPPDHVFSWTEHFPIRQTKVVILGQDPYHGPSQAHGLCFSVQKGVPSPPSLLNIYKELRTDIPDFVVPSHGNLTGWAQQGVLLLNAVLTVKAGNANSHKDMGWEKFTDAVVEWLNTHLSGLVFILWGRYAQVKGSKIDKKRHSVLTSAHPSPLSVTKFLGCKHFSQANQRLVKNGKSPVDWSRLSGE